jgi:hypothetical protein
MKVGYFVLTGLCALGLVPWTAAALSDRQSPQGEGSRSTFAEVVRDATAAFQRVDNAVDAGYVLMPNCVSGPQEGAMGVHYVNPTLFSDGVLDAERPEALVYEPRDGRLRLVAVEYIVPAAEWNASNPGPPVLNGQLFHYVGAPNRYGGPAFYELHVWAWKNNPSGTFADWNPKVSCDQYTGEGVVAASHGGH